jgi:pseudouridine-5'-phosphate glycosidase
LIVVPIPQSAALAADLVEGAVASALSAAKARGMEGNALTPFLLERVAQETQGASLEANVALLENNAGVAADIALALSEIPMP